MTKLRYYQQIDDLVTHTLLHLYFQISANSGYTPQSKRNDILIRRLKPLVKSSRYDKAKKDIKLLIMTGRKKGNIEEKLWNLYDLNSERKKNFTQADDLYILLTHLFDSHGFASLLTNGTDQFDAGVLYMEPLEIETGFNEDSIQIKPLTLFITKEHAVEVVTHINDFGGYQSCVTSTSENGEYAYISLTKVTSQVT